MFRIYRVDARESVVHGGREFTLVSSTWTVSLGRAWGLGWRYHHPRRVESPLGSSPIHDYVFLARLAALCLSAAIALATRRSHD